MQLLAQKKRLKAQYLSELGIKRDKRPKIKSKNHRIHKIKPTDQEPYKCDICENIPRRKRRSFFQAQKRFLKAQEFSEFVTNRDTDQALVKNHNCKKMPKHRRSHKIPINCGICGLGFDMVRKLNTHIRIHKTEKPFECDVLNLLNVCKRKPRQKRRSFFQAQKRLLRAQNFSEFDTNRDTDLTLTMNHDCKKMPKHRRSHKIPINCGICGLGFDMVRKLDTHIRIHKTEKPFECDVCEKSFTSPATLKFHMGIHTGEKPFKCDVCENSYFTVNLYKDHMKRQHTGEKSFHCGICGLGFDMTIKLGSHVKIHKTERPYECDVCGKSFIMASELKDHKKTPCYSISMSDQPCFKPVRGHLTLDMKHRIICEYEKEPRPAMKDLARKYGTSDTTIGNILKRKDDIIQALANNNINSNRKHLVYKHSKFEQVNKKTYEWFVSARSKKVPMSGPLIKTKASMFADEMKIGDFKATCRWLAYWKSCYDIKNFNEAV